MIRILNLLAFGIAGALAFLLYELKYETRLLEDKAAQLARSIEQERDAIAVLRAEWSHLNQPQRIERLAKKHLGLRPVMANQIITADELDKRISKRSQPVRDPIGTLIADEDISRVNKEIKKQSGSVGR